MCKRFLILWLLFCAATALAQFTTVTGTVTDPNGLAYAGGTITPTLTSSTTPTFIATGLAYTPPSQPTGLDGTGSFTVNLADVTQINPGASTWGFKVCSAAGTIQPAGGRGPVCFIVSGLAISGASQSISANLNAVAPALGFAGAGTLTGAGANTFIPKWTGATALGNSVMTDNGATVSTGVENFSTNSVTLSGTGAFREIGACGALPAVAATNAGFGFAPGCVPQGNTNGAGWVNFFQSNSMTDNGTSIVTTEPLSAGPLTSTGSGAGTLSMVQGTALSACPTNTPNCIQANSFSWAAPASITGNPFVVTTPPNSNAATGQFFVGAKVTSGGIDTSPGFIGAYITSIPAADTLAAAGTFATTEALPGTNLAVGSVIHILAKGRLTTTATASPLQNMQVNGGGTTGLCPAAGAAVTININQTNASWWLDCYAQIITTGNPGTAFTWGTWTTYTAAGVLIGTKGFTNTGTVSYITTSTQTVSIQETAALVAGQTFQLDDIIARVENY